MSNSVCNQLRVDPGLLTRMPLTDQDAGSLAEKEKNMEKKYRAWSWANDY
jgi:hypothetical protein